MAQLRADRFDHHFAGSGETVDLHGHLARTTTRDQHRRLARGTRYRCDAQTGRQVHVRIDFTGVFQKLLLTAGQFVQRGHGNFEQVDHGGNGNGVQVFPGVHHQGLGDGQGQW